MFIGACFISYRLLYMSTYQFNKFSKIINQLRKKYNSKNN